MAITALAVTPITRAGITDTLTAANADGHSIVNTSDNMWVEVLNGSGSSITVTFAVTQTVDGLAVSNRTVTIAAGVRKKMGPWPKASYSTSVTMTFSAVTTVTCGAFSLA